MWQSSTAASACRAQCLADEGCMGYMTQTGSKCSLVTQAGYAVRSDGQIAYACFAKLSTNAAGDNQTAFTNLSASSTRTTTTLNSDAQCAAACSLNPHCALWTFDRSTASCYLHTPGTVTDGASWGAAEDGWTRLALGHGVRASGHRCDLSGCLGC